MVYVPTHEWLMFMVNVGRYTIFYHAWILWVCFDIFLQRKFDHGIFGSIVSYIQSMTHQGILIIKYPNTFWFSSAPYLKLLDFSKGVSMVNETQIALICSNSGGW